MSEAKQVAKKAEPKKQFVLKEKKLDTFTTIRTRVLLTPCVCERCGFDLCEKNGLGEYDSLEVEEKARVKKAMEVHKEFHTTAENRVVDEDDIPTSWTPKIRKV